MPMQPMHQIARMHENQFISLQINPTPPHPHNLTPRFTTLNSLHGIVFPACCFESGKMPRCTGTALEFHFILLLQLGELQQKQSKPIRANHYADSNFVVASLRKDMQNEMALAAPCCPVSLSKLKPWRSKVHK